MTKRKCFLCGIKHDSKKTHITLHGFPSLQDVNGKWKQVCKLYPMDSTKNLFVCSKHFQPEDFYKPYSYSIKLKLKREAIPSRKVVNENGTCFDFTKLPSTSSENITPNLLSEPVIPVKKRHLTKPRFINEICPSHVTTPKCAREVIDMVKQRSRKQAINIKKLYDAKKHLMKKVKKLEDMVAHLKQNKMVSEQAGEQNI